MKFAYPWDTPAVMKEGGSGLDSKVDPVRLLLLIGNA